MFILKSSAVRCPYVKRGLSGIVSFEQMLSVFLLVSNVISEKADGLILKFQ